jgi:hypothetical protein
MASSEPFSTWEGARLPGRLARSIPFLGALVSAATLAATMRRKGALGGLADAGLDAIPFFGAAKNLVELVRGEDFFPDRAGREESRDELHVP